MVGVLAVQGGFIEHIHMLQRLGVDYFEIRQPEDLKTHTVDALILPGGESTVMNKLLVELELFDPLHALVAGGIPVFGTCAGMILLANQVENRGKICFGSIDICVKRNAYGRQLGSFATDDEFKGIGTVPMIFIRAPYVESAGPEVEILSRVDGHIVAARQNKVLVCAFHPELGTDTRIHAYFLKMAGIPIPVQS